jgi:hypothetical protein
VPLDLALRDLFEVLIVVAVGGMVASVLGRLRRGRLPVHRCPACHRPTSRAYPRCRHCGVGWDDSSDHS